MTTNMLQMEEKWEEFKSKDRSELIEITLFSKLSIRKLKQQLKALKPGAESVVSAKELYDLIAKAEDEFDLANAAIGIQRANPKPKVQQQKAKPNKRIAKAVLHKEMAQELNRELQKIVTPAQFGECLAVAKQNIKYVDRVEALKLMQD